jgi:Heparinase II/III-like protein/Heparinase II/III N-terminus
VSFSPLTAFKALIQLGFQPVALNALYRFGLATGHYRRITARPPVERPAALKPLLPLPDRDALLQLLGENGRTALLAEADEVVAGRARLFGGEPVALRLGLDGRMAHWTAYETNPKLLSPLYSQIPDIKFIWEPARFGWAHTLGRAFHASGDEKYAEAFWRYTEAFLDANPPYLGPHWISGQEVAIRLMVLVWAGQVFTGAASTTPERLRRLAQTIAAHAARIPPTLVYARSQGNNHLLTEAAGLYTAGLALAGHPSAEAWRRLGWRWLNEGLQAQIDGYGEYAQHSTNYQRLMLQVALWMDALLRRQERSWPRQTLEALSRSVHWLLALLDPEAGRTPNLGPNDGAYLFPLTICPYADFRPVLHAAARAFLRYDLPRGAWDEMGLWFGIPLDSPKYLQLPRYPGDQLYGRDSWAYLRTAQFGSRPSHADQLHFDLWWRGLNIARDAGTYLYNADPPWDNSLVTAFVHNTVTVDGRDQMSRAGRFLYLDWVNAYRQGRIEADERILQRVSGRHYGYVRKGVRHTRTVQVFSDGRWQVMDELLLLRLPWQTRPLRFRLHWLLPDWGWEIENKEEDVEISLDSPHGKVRLVLRTEPRLSGLQSQMIIVRAGERVYGRGEATPVMGWSSPTYGVKLPALSLALEVSSTQSVEFTSEFVFP